MQYTMEDINMSDYTANNSYFLVKKSKCEKKERENVLKEVKKIRTIILTSPFNMGIS